MATNGMATKGEVERLGIVETKVDTLIDGVKSINAKLDVVVETKADRAELKTFKLVTLSSAILISAIMGALVAFYFSHQNAGANNPTTSSTTTVNTPGGSTSTTSTKDGTPSTTSSATAHSDAAQPADSQTSNGGGGLIQAQVPNPKVP